MRKGHLGSGGPNGVAICELHGVAQTTRFTLDQRFAGPQQWLGSGEADAMQPSRQAYLGEVLCIATLRFSRLHDDEA